MLGTPRSRPSLAGPRSHPPPLSTHTPPPTQVGDEEGAAEMRRLANAGRLNQRLSQSQKQQQQGRGGQQKQGGGRKSGTGASTARAGGRRV